MQVYIMIPKVLRLLCRKGILLIKDYCNKNNINWEECGKVVIASEEENLNILENLFQRGITNGLKGIKKVNQIEVNKIEPYVKAKAGIFVPEESVVDFKEVATKYKEEILSLGGSIKYNSKVVEFQNLLDSEKLIFENGDSIAGDIIISVAGLMEMF